MPAEHYDKVLYPLQDKVIAIFKDISFYLTGGTALSRGYYQHRYSDDLDYFVNDHPDFVRIAEGQISRLSAALNDLHVALRGDNFIRLFVGPERLKLAMVNDVPARIGALAHHPVVGVIDSKETILANKITALIDRSMPKDVVDVSFLLKDGLSITKALLDAESKAAGVSRCLSRKSSVNSIIRSWKRKGNGYPPSG